MTATASLVVGVSQGETKKKVVWPDPLEGGECNGYVTMTAYLDGTVYYWASSMWPFERLWHVLISQNHSTGWPVTSMMQNYRAGRLASKMCANNEAHQSQAHVCGS